MNEALTHWLMAPEAEGVPIPLEDFLHRPETFLVYPDRMVRYQTPAEVTYALATGTSLVIDADIMLTFQTPDDEADKK